MKDKISLEPINIKANRHKCGACGAIRLERFMIVDRVGSTKAGRGIYFWQCGDCFDNPKRIK